MVADHPWWVLCIPFLVALFCLPVATDFRSHLSVGGWLPPQAEAVTVDHLLEQGFGRHTTSHYLLMSDPNGQLTVDDNDFQREMARVLAQVAELPGVTTVHTWQSVQNAEFSAALVSGDRTATIAIVTVDADVREATASMPDLQRAIKNDVLVVEVGGWPAVTQDFQTLTSRDLARAELISLPITIVLLLLIFGGVLLAVLPMLTTVLALVPTLAMVTLLSRSLETSIFAVNLVLMLGLAIGIDYALILINRYREERGNSEPRQALVTTVEHAGRTVIASGAAVITGLAGLLAIGTPAATSTALAAMAAVMCGVGAALTMLPAALFLMSTRIKPREPHRMAKSMLAWWPRWFALVARKPGLVLTVAGLVLIAFAAPAIGMRPAMPSMSTIPGDQPSRQMLTAVEESFPGISLSPITVIVEPRHGLEMTSRRNLERLATFITRLEETEGVARVTSVFSFLPAATTPAMLANGFALDRDLLGLTEPYLNQSGSVLEITLTSGISRRATEDFVQTLRKDGVALSEGDFTVLVGGEAATSLDLLDHLRNRVPWTLGLVLSLSAVVLFVQFRSLVLPVKAIILNSLALLAAFGLVVAIFQHGWLPGTSATGTTIVIVPLLMFCFLFGLSMDYEVIMLSRIREEWLATGDNLRAVSRGMQGSAGIVTSAAAIMVVVFAAFGTSELELIRQIGVGLALAVVIDATVIRLVALPAAMILMGKWNWWLPGQGADTRPARHQENGN